MNAYEEATPDAKVQEQVETSSLGKGGCELAVNFAETVSVGGSEGELGKRVSLPVLSSHPSKFLSAPEQVSIDEYAEEEEPEPMQSELDEMDAYDHDQEEQSEDGGAEGEGVYTSDQITEMFLRSIGMA